MRENNHNIEKIIIGTAQIGLDYGINNSRGKLSEKDSFELLKYAHQNGISILDTAEAYGNAHQIIGAFHEKFSNFKFRVITKVPKQYNGSFIKKVNDYIKELNVDIIDVLMYHSFDTFNTDLSKSKSDILQLKETGKINHSGVSIYTNEEFEQVIDADWIDVIQIPFNLLDNIQKRGDLIVKAKKAGKVIHSRSAFLQGLFFIDRENSSQIVKELKEPLSRIDEISKRYEIPLHTLALGYCLDQIIIDNVLIGVDSLNQLDSNLIAAKAELSIEVISEINKINIGNIDLLNPSLWRR